MFNARHLGWPLPNVWLGVTVCNQAEADEKIPQLLQIPAAVRFVSVEPMLGPIDLNEWLGKWVCENASGSCGHFIYPSHKDCNSDCEEDCDGHCPHCGCDIAYDAPWQHETTLDWIICGGESGPGARPMHPDWPRKLRDDCVAAGVPYFFKQWGEWIHTPIWSSTKYLEARKVGKKAAGHLLDGQEWRQMPEVTR
jgi:protein gp37